jgi:hypothetical protein
LAHLLVALQVVQFAAFAAARAAVVGDLDPSNLTDGEIWSDAGGSGEAGEKKRSYDAAMAVCERLEFYGYSGDYLRVKLDKHQVQDQQVLMTLQVAYLTTLPIPFGNRFFFAAFKRLGSARDADFPRVVLLQKCVLVKPWE